MLSRSIGSLVRGKGTPLQFMMACILGSMIGFVPGFTHAPGLVVALTLLLIVLNTNLFLALIVGLLAKFVALLASPLAFAIGRLLLDGPTQGVFKKLINAPIIAFFGFEYYTVTGGQVLGAIMGVGIGLALVKGVSLFRLKMSGVEENSERYKQWTSRRWVKIGTWVLAGGGKGKLSYADLLRKKYGNPVRPLGIALAAGAVLLLFLVKALASGAIIAAFLKTGLETANGATVDLQSAEIDLGAGRMALIGLAMADANALDTDLLRAARVEGQISTHDLLRKRIALDKVVLSDAATGEKRKAPGHLIGTRRMPPPDDTPPEGDLKRLEDYFNEAKIWKERLVQVGDWLEKLSGPSTGETAEEKQETLKERLERQIREQGYASIAATHLIEGAPTFLVRQITAEKVRTEQIPGETLDIHALNLSTHPNLVADAPKLTIRSSAATLDLDLDLGQACAAPRDNILKFAYRKIPTDSFAGRLSIKGNRPFTGGTFDVTSNGKWSTLGTGMIEMPMKLAFHDISVALPKQSARTVKEMLLPVGVSGSFERPRIAIDDKAWGKAFADAGVAQAIGTAKAEAGKYVDQAASRLGEKVGDDAAGKGKQLLQGLLNKPEPPKK